MHPLRHTSLLFVQQRRGALVTSLLSFCSKRHLFCLSAACHDISSVFVQQRQGSCPAHQSTPLCHPTSTQACKVSVVLESLYLDTRIIRTAVNSIVQLRTQSLYLDTRISLLASRTAPQHLCHVTRISLLASRTAPCHIDVAATSYPHSAMPQHLCHVTYHVTTCRVVEGVVLKLQ